MKINKNNGLIKFDSQIPVYNWFYPLQYDWILDKTILENQQSIFDVLDSSKAQSRAFYFHIPFCETICSFCPLIRSGFKNNDIVEYYTQALIREIEVKAKYQSLCEVPIEVIAFGGGTPSILSPEQIIKIGNTIKKTFNLTQLKEFSFEMEVKSITYEKLVALKEIGVTHARFGLQTFNLFYRRLFNLTSTLEQVRQAVSMLREFIPYTSFDILYGMNGQTEEQFISDIQQAIELNTPTIDFYPICNIVSQVRLHREFEKAGLEPKTPLAKFSMNVLLNEYMRASGYLPHSGHGFVKMPTEIDTKQPVVTNYYSCRYQEYVNGYGDQEIIGFGASGISHINGFTVTNVLNRDEYIKSLLENNTWDLTISKHRPHADASRGVIMHLPYEGHVEKSRIDWEQVHPDTLSALSELVDAKLVLEKEDRYEMTQVGWYWYANLMYYLTPKQEQRVIDKFIAGRRSETGRKVEDSHIAIEMSAQR